MPDYAYRGKTDLLDECLEITNYVQATRCVLHQHTQPHRQTKLRLKAFNNFFLSEKIWYWLKQMKIFKIDDVESPWHLYFLFFNLRTTDSSCSSSTTCWSRETMHIFTKAFDNREDYIQETFQPGILSHFPEVTSSKQFLSGVLLSIRTQLHIAARFKMSYNSQCHSHERIAKHRRSVGII